MRDFTFYFFLEGWLHWDEIIFKKVNVSLSSCDSDIIEFSSNNFSKKFQFDFDSLREINSERWLPVYVDNSEWSHIEFVCSIKIEFFFVFNNKKANIFENVSAF